MYADEPTLSTPKNDGFMMPAEWAPHEKCWMHWPYRRDNWRLGAGPAQKAYTDVIRAIAEFEHVCVTSSSCCWDSASELLKGVSNVTLIRMETDDAWMRDTGATFVIKSSASQGKQHSGELRGIDWYFNSWGNLMSYENDNKVAKNMCSLESIRAYSTHEPKFVLEGGSIHVDGEGTCLVTEECLLHPNRNPEWTKIEIEQKLISYLGVDKVIWLSQGLTADEDTNGHVDNMCCFFAPGKVLLAWTDDPSDEFYEVCRGAKRQLMDSYDAAGRRIEVVELPVPPVMHYAEGDMDGLEGDEMVRHVGQRLAASYVNFYIANGGIIVPGFGHAESDSRAVSILSSCFPQHRVVQVMSAKEILLGGGNIHCITQQQPKVQQ